MPKYDIQRARRPPGASRGSEGRQGAANAPPLPLRAGAGPVGVKPQLATVKAVDLRTDEGKTRVVVLLDQPSSTRSRVPIRPPRC